MINSYIILNRKTSFIIKLFLFIVLSLILLVIWGINTFYYQSYLKLHSQILYFNPNYYLEIMDRFSAKPEETLMIGNDVNEDILPCEKIGVDTFLVLDGVINAKNHDTTNIRQGYYKDLIEYLKSL